MNVPPQSLHSLPSLPGFDLPGDAASFCLNEIFERQVRLTPDAPALECGDRRFSYAELEREANRLARLLRSFGVGPGSFVGLCFDRSELPIIAILACHKSGGAYVPLDPGHPDERLQYIAREADIRIILTQSRLLDRAAGISDRDVLALETWADEIAAHAAEPLGREENGLAPQDVCYVLYTSGTTGRPKGVVAEHRNVAHFVAAFNKACLTSSEDRIFQGFALGFDGSVEEIWMAFSNGACLVAGEPDTPRFGNELARFLAEKEITYFSTVPTVLSTMTEDIPSLTQVVVSGEACPPELVNRWSRADRLMLNVYGPTEATVNTTAARLVPDRPVTIGQAIEGYQTLILDEQMRPVPPGSRGELYVGGPSISRGYLKQPELTERAFVRLYRTGDLARINDDGELEFFGRIDGQVKLRGYRVELSEIEAVLVEQPSITSTSVKLHEGDNGPCLAAYIVLTDGADEPDRTELLETLRARLPPYMVPSYLDVLDALPMLSTGKTDRKRLPDPVRPLVTVSEDSEIAEADTPLEERIAEIWAEVFDLPKIGVDQDFFRDLGGHSLTAAKLAGLMRERLGVNVAVRDIYGFPTVARLADCILEDDPDAGARGPRSAPGAAASDEADDVEPEQPAGPPPERHEVPKAVSRLQFLFLAVLGAVLSLPLVLILPPITAMLRGETPVLEVFLLVIFVALAMWPSLILLGLVGKWLIMGRMKPGAYPLWGSYYLRWWMASWLISLMGLQAFSGTPFAPLMWRLLGARVGRRCLLNCDLPYAPDCLAIGRDTSIGSDTQLTTARIEGGKLLIGTVEIGSRCYIGTQSVIGLGARMEDDARLGDQSLLPDGQVMAAGDCRAGAPAKAAEVPVPEGGPRRRFFLYVWAFGLIQLASFIILDLVLSLPFMGAAVLAGYLIHYNPITVWAPLLVAALPFFIGFFCIYVVWCKNIIDPRPTAGVFDVYSRRYLQYWLVDNLMRTVRTIALPIFTTLYLPSWMRRLGARLGRHTEMATVWSLYPDALEAGDGVFFADGCIVGPSRMHLGRFEIRVNEIGDASFIGNSALLPSGAALGSNCLLGVLSTPPDPLKPTPDDTDWLGSPGFELPNRDRNTTFDARTTYRPSLWLYLKRGVIDGLRILLPPIIVGGLGIGVFAALIAIHGLFGIWAAYAAALPLAAGAMAGAVATVVLFKWLLMGRFRPVVVPLWSGYVWRNELINGLYETVMLPIVSTFAGTPFAAPLLRLLGCRIGRHCYIGAALFSEFDLVEIGDYAALNVGSIAQTHLFEDRVMKSDRLLIGDGCTLGELSVVLYDTRMENDSILGPLSLLMKGEVMPPRSRWHGIPTV